MAREVFTPMLRRVVPGACLNCGFDDGWESDGRGTITCECQSEDDNQAAEVADTEETTHE